VRNLEISISHQQQDIHHQRAGKGIPLQHYAITAFKVD